MTFEEVCHECIKYEGFVNEWNRLTGNKLGIERAPIVKMIDDACGHDPDMKAMGEFVDFVFEFVWLPLKG
ncbi:MAG: hypothetical protein FWB73_05925 [Treponema sp.]|nr:hypothetical protein [Treponema sp.]